MEQPTTPGGEAEEQRVEEVGRALVVRPEHSLAPVEPPMPTRAGLPARVAERLPALWREARGPLTQAVVAGGLLALGSVMGRQAAGGSLSLLPTRRPARAVQTSPRTTRIEAEVSEGVVQSANGAVVQWVTRRVRVTLE